MHSENEIKIASHNDVANSVFQVLTIALIGVFTLTEALKFVASVVA